MLVGKLSCASSDPVHTNLGGVNLLSEAKPKYNGDIFNSMPSWLKNKKRNSSNSCKAHKSK